MSKRLDRELENLEEMRKLIDRIEEIEDSPELSDWESGFLSDIKEKVLRGNSLSDSQSDKLDEIEDIAVNGRSWDG